MNIPEQELSEEHKKQLLADFDAVVEKQYEKWQHLPENKDIKVYSNTINDPIQLKLIVMSIDHTKLHDASHNHEDQANHQYCQEA